MNISLIVVGSTDISWVKEGLEMYVSRLKHYTNFSIVEIPQLKNVSSLSPEMIRRKEGELILKALKPASELILLDEKGKEYRSVEFADLIRNRLNSSRKELSFVIGGAYGFSPEVYSRADSMLALSKMTFSHQGVRTIFAEQLYRAFTIIRGEPYHNE